MKYLYLLSIFTLIAWSAPVNAQIHILNATGGTGKIQDQIYDYSIAEMVLTETFNVPDTYLTQGFLQPVSPVINPEFPVPDFPANNVITPNADGKNDFLVIKDLDKFPPAKIKIYDRAGRVIYASDDYKNNWDGKVNGKPLNEDTYYYVIFFGKEYGLIRGFVSIILDTY